MKRLILLILFLSFKVTMASEQAIVRGTLPNPCDHVCVDTEGNKYDIDALLDAGKHIAIHLISDT